MIKRCVAVSEHIAKGDDESAFWNTAKERYIQLAQLPQSVPGDIQLPLDRGPA